MSIAKLGLGLVVLVLGALAILFLVWGGGGMVETFQEGPGGKRIAVALLVIPGWYVGRWAVSLWNRIR